MVCVVLVIVMLPTTVLAKDNNKPHDMTKEFSQSVITGDGAADIVSAAKAQIGKYGYDLGYSKELLDEVSEWCAVFVMNCAKYAGQTDAVPFAVSKGGYGCRSAWGLLMAVAKTCGGKVIYNVKKHKGSIENAIAGDLVGFDWEGNGSIDHIEIVSKVKRNADNKVVNIKCIGGNTYKSGKTTKYTGVWENNRYTSGKGTDIAFIVRPKYSNRNTVFYNNSSGKNYLIDSDFMVLNSKAWSVRNSIYGLSVEEDNELGYNALRIDASESGADKKDIKIRTLTQGSYNDGYAGDNKNMTFSFWAKSSVKGAKMYIRWGNEDLVKTQKITLSKTWTQYSVRLDKEKTFSNNIFVFFSKPGTFWLSQVQLEDGTGFSEFTPESGEVCAKAYNKKLNALPEPSRAGYTFKGWYKTDSDFSDDNLVSDLSDSKRLTTLYASWDRDFNVKFYLGLCRRLKDSNNSGFLVTVTDLTGVWTMPCISQTDKDSEQIVQLPKGTVIRATGAYNNTAKHKWYEVNYKGCIGYVYSGNVKMK